MILGNPFLYDRSAITFLREQEMILSKDGEKFPIQGKA